MAGLGVFHVEFGINDTQLTRTLEQGDHREAERIIRRNYNASYLDEGCYQRTPLFIVLCGSSQEGHSTLRNLHLAKLLVENGASVNKRVPTTFFGCEYMGPGQTAVELVVDFFNLITKHECHIPDDLYDISGWDPREHKVMGLDKQVVTSFEDIKEQLAELLAIMIASGGDANIRDEFHMTPLHRTVVFSQDTTLMETLCDGGADINAQDIRGNTPLSALCDAFPLGIQHFLEEMPMANPYRDCCHLRDKQHFAHYLIEQKDIKLDVQNKLGRTGLFNCLVRGDMQTSWELLKHGCDPALRGQVRDRGKVTREISPLFASLSSLRVVSQHCERYSTSLSKSYQFLAHLVDAGFFTKSQITSELFEYLDQDFPKFQHLKGYGTRLIHLMFGGTTTTLLQLSARAIFQSAFLHSIKPLQKAENLTTDMSLGVSKISENISIDLADSMDCAVVEAVGNMLGLPRTALKPRTALEVEVLRHLLLDKFRHLRWFKYYDEEIDGVYGDTSDSDEFPSDEGDSDIEYW